MNSIELYTANLNAKKDIFFTDFRIGSIELAKHLDVKESLSALDVDPRYARQLLLMVESDFESGRIPLYVCSCCADLGCGALTVHVEKNESGYKWSNFGWESPHNTAISQSQYMRRTGPFFFEKEQYVSAINPYTKR